MDFTRLANIVRKIDNIKFIAKVIEGLEGTAVESVDDLSEALEDALYYANDWGIDVKRWNQNDRK